MNRTAPFALVVSGGVMGLALAGCSNAKMVGVDDISKAGGARPAVVYVADFELAPDSIQSKTLTASLPIHSFLERSKAQSLVTEMSAAIVQDLAKDGIIAVRVPANGPFPKQGWLVRGVFTTVNEGNRVRRAVIGMESGQTDVAVTTSTEELSAGTAPRALYQAQVDAKSGKLPGAAVTLNPYVAAAKYVLAGFDLDVSTHQTAQEIADQVAARVKRAS
jgi:Domain of unknown function (DUF4410)